MALKHSVIFRSIDDLQIGDKTVTVSAIIGISAKDTDTPGSFPAEVDRLTFEATAEIGEGGWKQATETARASIEVAIKAHLARLDG